MDAEQQFRHPDRAALLRHLGLTDTRIPAHADQQKAFAQLTAGLVEGTVTVPPYLLSGRRRRIHIRNTILEDHRGRLHLAPDAVAGKMDLIAADAFSFFRGTALLYYRDLVGEDTYLRTVPSIGDVHPENFGILPGADGHPIFSANDFDEAWPAPFTWDVHRGAVGFALQARSLGYAESRWWKAARAFLRGYVTGVESCLLDPDTVRGSVTGAEAPDCLQPFFTKAGRDRASFLRRRIDMDTCTFLETPQVTRLPGMVAAAGRIVELYASKLAPAQRPDNFFTVRDVASRTGSGTASLGLPRFWVLVEGWGPGAGEKVIIEFKLSRHSVLQGLVATGIDGTGGARNKAEPLPAERTALAFREFVSDGDPLYGHVELGALTFLARERSPMKVNVDASSFSWSGLRDYARICGTQTAYLHGRPGAGTMRDIAEQVHAEVFLADGEEFVRETATRVLEDHQLFCEDVSRGAFRTIGVFNLD